MRFKSVRLRYARNLFSDLKIGTLALGLTGHYWS
jgi:hypothetical protein